MTTDKEKTVTAQGFLIYLPNNFREREHDSQESSNLDPSINIMRNFVTVNSF